MRESASSSEIVRSLPPSLSSPPFTYRGYCSSLSYITNELFGIVGVRLSLSTHISYKSILLIATSAGIQQYQEESLGPVGPNLTQKDANKARLTSTAHGSSGRRNVFCLYLPLLCDTPHSAGSDTACRSLQITSLRKKFNLSDSLYILLRHCDCQYCRCTSDRACRGCVLATKLLLESFVSSDSSRNPDMPQGTALNCAECRQIALLALLRSWTSCDRCRSSAEARVCTQPCNKFMASGYRGLLMTSKKPIVTSGTRHFSISHAIKAMSCIHESAHSSAAM